MLDESDAEADQGATSEQEGKKPDRALKQGKEAGREGAHEPDEEPTKTRDEWGDYRSEKLRRDPEQSKSK